MVGRYRCVLEVSGSRRLYAAGVLARVPQGMSSLSILLLVRASTHSYAVAGLAVGGEALAAAAVGPLQGRLVDRFGRGRVLTSAALTQAILLVGLAVAVHTRVPDGALVLLACGVGAAQPATAPSVRALLGTLFADLAVRERAYALDSIVQELIWITGPLLVALVVTASSPAAAVVLAAALYLVGTSLLVASPVSRAHPPARAPRRGSVLHGSPELRALLALAVVCGLPLIFARSIPAGLLGAMLTGLTIAPVFACQYALVGRAVTEGSETEAFTWMSSALIAGSAGGSALGGALVGGLGVAGPFVLACGALALAALCSTRVRSVAVVG